MPRAALALDVDPEIRRSDRLVQQLGPMMLPAVELAQITELGSKVTGSQPYLPYVPASP